jgi:hypothetical protein
VIITKKLAPPNSILLVMDSRIGEPPMGMGGDLVAATASCVAIGTLSDVDGETTVEFADEPSSPAGLVQVFDGRISTPSRAVDLCTALLEPVVHLSVPSVTSRVRVWANHGSEPDRLLIVVSGAP